MSIINTKFNDIYSVAYRVIGDAKKNHNLVKLYKGSHILDQPHENVFKFLNYFSGTQQGVLAFIKSSDVAASNINIDRVMKELYIHESKGDESYSDFRDYILTRKHNLGAYRGGGSGYSAESKALICEYFRQFGYDFNIGDINIFSGGVKGAFMSFCAALFSSRFYDDVNMLGGNILMPTGYYQSLRNIPSIFKCQINVVDVYDCDTVSKWIQLTKNVKRRAIYIPTVNNANGKIISNASIKKIMLEVVKENLAGREIFVFWDDVYRGSYLGHTDKSISTEFMISYQGKNYKMSDFSVVATSSSKTYALPTARVCFAATSNIDLYKSMEHYQILMSYGRVSQLDELCALVAMCCTPEEWIQKNNEKYRENLAYLRDKISKLNEEYVQKDSLVTIDIPDGGWYFILKISKNITDHRMKSSIEFSSVLLNYSDKRDSGIACLPGELFGYFSDDNYIYRCTVAVDKIVIDNFVDRLTDLISALNSKSKSDILNDCSLKLSNIVNVEKLMENTRY